MTEQTDHYEEFEKLAEQFRKDTGMMAPGKDDSLGDHSPEERLTAWECWIVRQPHCPECQGAPCFCHTRKTGATHCVSCGAPLGLRGGMGGSDLCGPCCTGEADTLKLRGIDW